MTENKNEEQTLENETIEESAAEAVFAEEEIPAEENDGPVEKDELQLAHEKIAELEAKIEEMDNRYLRLQADFDNSRRRAKLDMEAAQKYRVQSIASDLVEALDNFERATKSKRKMNRRNPCYPAWKWSIKRLLVHWLKKASNRSVRLAKSSIRVCIKRSCKFKMKTSVRTSSSRNSKDTFLKTV